MFFQIDGSVRLYHRLYEVYFNDSLPQCIVTVHLRGVIFRHDTAELSRLSEAKA